MATFFYLNFFFFAIVYGGRQDIFLVSTLYLNILLILLTFPFKFNKHQLCAKCDSHSVFFTIENV